jgi:hypothetical protein
MRVVWTPPMPKEYTPREQHEHALEEADHFIRGTIALCDCSKFFKVVVHPLHDDGGPYGTATTDYFYQWRQVRWYHFISKHRIQKWKDGQLGA